MDKLFATFGSGNCFKAHLAFRQLNRPYQLAWIDVLKGEQKSEAFLALNPNGTVPFLVTESGEAIGESNAMLWHIAQASPLMPQSNMDQAQTIQWMIFEQTKLEPFISPARFFSVILPERKDEMAAQIADWQDKGRVGMTRLDAHLRTRDFMVGSHYSIADIAIFGYVNVANEAGLDFADSPAVARWCDRIKDQPGYFDILAIKPD